MRNIFDISVIIPVRNSQTTLESCFKSILEQSYPIKEVIFIDNNSSDNSGKIIENFKNNSKKIPVRIYKQKENKGLTVSYKLGIEKSKFPYLVVMHSDGKLPGRDELKKLLLPFEKTNKIIATYPIILHPKTVWKKYNFWQKLYFSRVVDTKSPGLNGKFDCYKKEAIKGIYGILKKRFVNTDVAGGEDWDLYSLLRKEGDVVQSKAYVEHLHSLDKNYSLLDFLKKRKHVAKSYGKLLRLHGKNMNKKGIIAFTTKPVLAISSLISPINIFSIPLIVFFSFFYTKRMFFEKETLFDIRILLLPLLNIFLIYYESFWTIESIFTSKD